MYEIGLPFEHEGYTTTTDHFYNAFDQDWYDVWIVESRYSIPSSGNKPLAHLTWNAKISVRLLN